eukprot:TRINITY_DN2939_c0_g1_i1.p1 TRINITY_DN2939_c0_g1~~TRINITY_DN2939_c0_g1_i1.p1  ORF type:complete len:1060 (+),score=200.31 TRINITY_DN2939_c0_g1_i1:218-3397(+)
MGAEASKGDATEVKGTAEYLADLDKACSEKHDLALYKEVWQSIEKRRPPLHCEERKDFDEMLLQGKSGAMKYLRFAFQHSDASWREEGIKMARTFFQVKVARDSLAKPDFISSVLLITLSGPMDDKEGETNEESPPGDDKQGSKHDANQKLAAEIILDMANHEEFLPSLCDSAVLNFLCMFLNQVEDAAEYVTHTFVKLAAKEDNLAILMDASVGDILESFFKTVKLEQLSDETKSEKEKREIKAMAYTADTLGTFVKFGHSVQVDLATIIRVFDRACPGKQKVKKDSIKVPDNVHLLAEMARLFYWVCRRSADPYETVRRLRTSTHKDESEVLKVLLNMWKRCRDTYDLVERSVNLGVFLTDDFNFSEKLILGTPKANEKIKNMRKRLCYMNCALWILLPLPELRWRFRESNATWMNLAFKLKGEGMEEFQIVILSTVRHLLDLPMVQECSDLVGFFGKKLLGMLDQWFNSRLSTKVTRLLLDAICVFAMQRESQVMLAENDIWAKLEILDRTLKSQDLHNEASRYDEPKLRIYAQVALHPRHRLSWVAKANASRPKEYPPRTEFRRKLDALAKVNDSNTTKTIVSLLLMVFQEQKFARAPAEGEMTFQSLFDWWRVNSTARYEEERDAADAVAMGMSESPAREVSLGELLLRAQTMRESKRFVTSMETMNFCAPHECVFALSLFSRLALEPKLKFLLFDRALEDLLKCICVGVWAEAREAAATIANLMYLPDSQEEHLVCWLKFDSMHCIAVDAANVLLPIQEGNPRPADIGKGMYMSTWGMEFVKGSYVILHENGLKTHRVPATLTSASPTDTFAETSVSPYQWLIQDPPDEHNFTISCWFYRPPKSVKTPGRKVLVASKSGDAQICLVDDAENDGVWVLSDKNHEKIPLKTPRLNPGWHMLALVSSKGEDFDGTKFFLGTWHVDKPDIFIKNDFYFVGNDASKNCSFGLICDFRIYAKALTDADVEAMATVKSTAEHPDRIVRRLAELDAATILAERLDVPDSAAECLRALGSLATLESQRAKIFGVCGRRVLQLTHSPLENIKRQAHRLINNLA